MPPRLFSDEIVWKSSSRSAKSVRLKQIFEIRFKNFITAPNKLEYSSKNRFQVLNLIDILANFKPLDLFSHLFGNISNWRHSFANFPPKSKVSISRTKINRGTGFFAPLFVFSNIVSWHVFCFRKVDNYCPPRHAVVVA